jgi:hypothetical protein
MTRRLLLAVFRVVLAGATIVAMLAQAAELARRDVLDPVNFVSFFTIQSNAIGAAVFLIGAARWRAPATSGWDLVRGAAALNLTITYVVFALLLSNADVAVPLPWVNDIVHVVFPLAVIADWLVDPPSTRIDFAGALRWLIYPLAWLAYTLVRGAVTGWYPYPFLDPANGGWGSVAVYVLGIFVFGLVVMTVLRLAGNALRGRRLIPAVGTTAG